MFDTATRRLPIRLFIAAAALAALGCAVRMGEDGMLGSSNIVSTWIFGIAAIALYYAILSSIVLWSKRRRSNRRPADTPHA